MTARPGDPTIADVIERGLVSVAFQPIVELAGGDVVAHEALARGPSGTALEAPTALFAAAGAARLTDALDELCMRTAFRAARHAGIRTLFVNAEPSVFGGPVVRPETDMQVVVEVTERGVVDRPAELLDALERSREAGWGVALDDIGADWRSLAMLPVIAPEVIKLDRGVIAGGPSRESSRILRASRAQIDRHAGILLAEGIEDPDHAQQAIAFGAALGQGFLLGRPAPSPARSSAPPLGFTVPSTTIERELTPFGLLRREGIATAVTTKRQLLPIARDIEDDAAEQSDPNILLGTFEDAELFGAATRERYARLAEGLAYVAVFGCGIEPRPAAGVVGASLEAGEALAEEWVVVSIGPHQTSALIARDLGDEVADLERRFEYALLSGRDIIEQAARSLMLRITATAPPGR
jgi:EAL domain-containing protein (putative c-di-GMP-specific phosphodiesterase class I)/DICT domain-containing protein